MKIKTEHQQRDSYVDLKGPVVRRPTSKNPGPENKSHTGSFKSHKQAKLSTSRKDHTQDSDRKQQRREA